MVSTEHRRGARKSTVRAVTQPGRTKLAKPFLKPAFNSSKDAAAAAALKAVGDEVQKQIAKAGVKS